MRSGIRIGAVVALLLAAPGLAQPPKEPTTYNRAVAAGYKALTLCSGIFNAGRTQAQIEALELKGIYPEYDAIVPTLEAAIDRKQERVLVAFDRLLPPRHASRSFPNGCAVAPIGQPVPADAMIISERPVTEMPVDPRWPLGDGGIEDVAPIARGLRPAVGRAFDASSYGAGKATTAVVIVRKGRIVAERYADGFGPKVSQRTWSVAKSLTATLVGAASLRGLVDTAKAARIEAWSSDGDPRRAITLDNLLRMAGGLHSDTAGNRTDAIYFGGTSVSEQATAWPRIAEPGTRFRYANNDTLLAALALRSAHRQADRDLFPNAFFDRIGMRNTIAETDWRGNFILSSQVWSTARDLARFGMLYLNDGVWNGERILPEGWRTYVTSPSGPQPPTGDFGYGAGFWLMNKSPGVPADAFAAFGNRGQYVVIVPSRNIVIVRRGEDPHGSRFDIARFTADVLAALK